MTTLIHCIYASTASTEFTESGVADLLTHARANNAEAGITGMLLYVEGSFFQVLEGEEATVARVFTEIKRDPRHRRVVEIIREPILERVFSDWSMGYARVGREDAGILAGENDFFQDEQFLERLSPGRAKKLLRAFRSGSWRSDETGAFAQRGRVA